MAIMSIQFFSNCLRRDVTLQALLPIDCFSSNNETNINETKEFKSLYLLHGFHGTHTDWLYNTAIRDLANKHNIAVFMPSGENFFYVDDVDKGEYHGAFIGEELVAMSRAMFPLSTKREDTMIAGLSMGGYGAIRNGLKYNDTFGKIIALSSALVTYNLIEPQPENKDGIAPDSYFPRVFGSLDKVKGSDKDVEALVTTIIASKGNMPQLYMACGDEDFLLPVNQKFHQFLVAKGVNHTYEETSGVHDWDYWRKHIKTGLTWALA